MSLMFYSIPVLRIQFPVFSKPTRKVFLMILLARLRQAFILVFLSFFGSLAAIAQTSQSQQAAPQQMRLAKVEFKGLEHITQAQALDLSGLVPGEPITVESLDTAAQRLVDSGLFGKMTYRIRSVKQDANVEFEVEELRGNIPVVFDNFVWFSEEELLAGVKSEMPSFNGTAPESGNAPELIKKGLTRMLRAANVNGEVQYTLSTSESGSNAKHVFTVTGVKIPVCSVHYGGAVAVKEEALIENSNGLLGKDFSREIADAFPSANLIPVYQQLGRLRAQINFDNAKLVESDSCKDGVAVTYIVDEGDIYTWGGSDWSGNVNFPSDELTRSLGMRPNEVADIRKIEKAIGKIRDFYGKRGYMALRLKSTPNFDDRSRSVTYGFAISEGPQYKMGNLTIKGIPGAVAEKLTTQWKLQRSDVYDSTYPALFLKLVQRSADVKTILNKDNLTVDVEIKFN
jgi:outer membrane protein insertion porin family